LIGGGGRLLFDECLPPPCVARLAEFLDPARLELISYRSLFDLAPPGTRDEDWIPLLKDQGWTVISSDGGRTPNKNRGRKLPDLCSEFGVTLIVLSSAVHHRKVVDKVRTIASVWDQIVEIASDPASRGRRFVLEPMPERDLGLGRIVARPTRRRPGDGPDDVA